MSILEILLAAGLILASGAGLWYLLERQDRMIERMFDPDDDDDNDDTSLRV